MIKKMIKAILLVLNSIYIFYIFKFLYSLIHSDISNFIFNVLMESRSLILKKIMLSISRIVYVLWLESNEMILLSNFN